MKRPNPRDEIQHLLGGYAAGTLTPAEQKLLFEAAMEDQALFDAMADEQALKELLDDPESRGYLRAALEEVSQPDVATSTPRRWWPKVAAASAFAAVLTLVTVLGIRQAATDRVASSKSVEVAQNTPPPAPRVLEAPATKRKEIANSGAAGPVSAPAPAPRKVIEPEADAATAPVPTPASTPAAVATQEKKAEVAAAAPPPVPSPAVAAVRAEPRDQELAKSAPSSPAVSGRAALNLQQFSASELFLAQYRQNFLQAANGGGSGQTFGQLGDAASAAEARRKSQARPARQQPQQNQIPAAEDRLSQRPPGANAESTASLANRGIRYQILRRNSQGNLIQTRLDTRFEAGDEIQLQIEKNAPGVVNVFAGLTTVALVSQNDRVAVTVPIRLTAGLVDLAIVFAENPSGLQPALPAQLTEQSGNLMYVVLPGATPSPVVAKFRITVYQP